MLVWNCCHVLGLVSSPRTFPGLQLQQPGINIEYAANRGLPALGSPQQPLALPPAAGSSQQPFALTPAAGFSTPSPRGLAAALCTPEHPAKPEGPLLVAAQVTAPLPKPDPVEEPKPLAPPQLDEESESEQASEAEEAEQPTQQGQKRPRSASILEVVGHVQQALDSRKGKARQGRPKGSGKKPKAKPGRPPKPQAAASSGGQKPAKQKPCGDAPPSLPKDGRPVHFLRGAVYTDQKRKIFRVIADKTKSRSDCHVKWDNFPSTSKAWDYAIDLIKIASSSKAS